jgi:hypothetical protein
MSQKPDALATFNPTGCVVSPRLLTSQDMFEPPAQGPVVLARQAYSHSTSVGKVYLYPAGKRPAWRFRTVSFSQNSNAINQETRSTGASRSRA